jgi:hypothetical protein
MAISPDELDRIHKVKLGSAVAEYEKNIDDFFVRRGRELKYFFDCSDMPTDVRCEIIKLYINVGWCVGITGDQRHGASLVFTRNNRHKDS